MNKFVQKLDSIAGIQGLGAFPTFLERTTFILFLLMILMAPHSIAATQISWLLGMIVWIVRHFVSPAPKTKATFLAVPILALYGWTVISSIVSYAPDISMGKLRGAVLFFIFFFALNHLRTQKAVKLAAGALIFSCMINVFWMPLERLIGKGVKIQGVSTESPLYRAGFREGDNLFKVNDKSLSSPAGIITEIEKSGEAEIEYYRDGHYWRWKVARGNLLSGNTDLEKLGIGGWTKSRSWRSSGFYGQYMTYAEVLQLIGSLAFGMLIACLGVFLSKNKKDGNREAASTKIPENSDHKRGLGPMGLRPIAIILAFCFAMLSFALLLTITRAPQAGIVVSAAAIVVINGGRKLLIALLLVTLPVVIAGAIFLQQTRGVGFFDGDDASTTWRLTVYREGFDLWTSSPRNFVFGVGMDTIKRFKEEWHLFDDGKIQSGHFHSTPLQLLVERGFPALLFWLWMFGAYIWTLLRSIKRDAFADWKEKGIVLGAFGGCLGFLLSSLVHYNFGDGEVVMVLYMIMAMGMAIALKTFGNNSQASPAPQG